MVRTTWLEHVTFQLKSDCLQEFETDAKPENIIGRFAAQAFLMDLGTMKPGKL